MRGSGDIAVHLCAAKKERDPSARDIRDQELKKEIIRVEKEDRAVCAQEDATSWTCDRMRSTRRTVERLMEQMGIAGSAVQEEAAAAPMPAPLARSRPSDLVGRGLHCPGAEPPLAGH